MFLPVPAHLGSPGQIKMPNVVKISAKINTMRPDVVAPSRLVGVFASVNLPLHHKVQKFSSGTSSPVWSRKKGRKMVVVCGGRHMLDG